MKKEEVLKRDTIKSGVFEDSYIYGLTKSDYQKNLVQLSGRNCLVSVSVLISYTYHLLFINFIGRESGTGVEKKAA